MPNPLWLGTGGCPSVAVTATVTPLFCSFQGFYPFMAWTAAPTLYQKFTVTQDADVTITITPGSPGSGGSFPQQETDVLSAITTSAKDETTPDTHIAITNGGLSPGANSGFDTTIGGSFPNRSGQSATGISENDLLDPGGRLHGFNWKAHFASATLFQLKTTHQVVGGTAGGVPATYAINAATQSVELVEPDTDDDAIARAAEGGFPEDIDATGSDDFGFGSGLFSLHETRPDGDWVTFGYRSGMYQLACVGLSPGVLYRYVVVWEARDAVGIGLDDDSAYGPTWANSDSATGTFRPTGTTYTTGDLAIPTTAGKQKRIKSVNVTAIEG